ncbi:GNAT family N-acetyltransferase [Gryllotalpicola koreensis]
MGFSIRDECPGRAELVALYESVGWSAYTAAPERLEQAVAGSHLVLCARDEDNGNLLGLARTISDGQTIAYLQDLLVAPGHQRRGIGGALLDEVLDRTHEIRQFVLLTDAEPAQRAFYESRRLVETHDARPNELRAFVRLA